MRIRKRLGNTRIPGDTRHFVFSAFKPPRRLDNLLRKSGVTPKHVPLDGDIIHTKPALSVDKTDPLKVLPEKDRLLNELLQEKNDLAAQVQEIQEKDVDWNEMAEAQELNDRLEDEIALLDIEMNSAAGKSSSYPAFKFCQSGFAEIDGALTSYGAECLLPNCYKDERSEMLHMKIVDPEYVESVISEFAAKNCVTLDSDEILTQFVRAIKEYRQTEFLRKFTGRFCNGISLESLVLPTSDCILESKLNMCDDERVCLLNYADGFEQLTMKFQHVFPEEDLF